jgi:hypothetical protein
MSKKKQQRRSNMKELIQEYLNTPNIPQRKFCELHQIPLSTFQYNLRKYRERQSGNPKKQKAHFIPITLTEKDQAAKPQSACEISWPNGLVVRFESAPGVNYLLSLIAAGESRL